MIEVRGLEEFQQSLERVRRRYPDEEADKLIELGKKLKKKVIDKTPRKNGKLKKSYKMSGIKQMSGVKYVEFNSTSSLFHLIERGHKVITVHKNSNGEIVKKEHGFKEGVHMVENSSIELDEELPEEIGRWLDELLRELD